MKLQRNEHGQLDITYHEAISVTSAAAEPMSGTASHDPPAPQKRLAQSEPSSWGSTRPSGAASSLRPTNADCVLSQCSCFCGHKQCGVWFMKGYHPDESPHGAQPADKCLECRRDVPGGSCGCFCWECNFISWDPAVASAHALSPAAHGSELPLPLDAQVVDLTNMSDSSESPWSPALAEAAATAPPPSPPLPPATMLPRRPRPYLWTRPMAPATRRSTNTRANPYDGRTGPRPAAGLLLSDTS